MEQGEGHPVPLLVVSESFVTADCRDFSPSCCPERVGVGLMVALTRVGIQLRCPR